jgi:hypothetical protein
MLRGPGRGSDSFSSKGRMTATAGTRRHEVWVKLDDRFTDNAKIARLSDKAFRVYVHALCYSAGALTDGLVPWSKAKSWASLKTIGEMTAAGLWDEVKLGYQIHDYLDYQQSREQVNAKRMQAASAAQSRWQSDSQSDSHQISNGKGTGIGQVQGTSDFAERLISKDRRGSH